MATYVYTVMETVADEDGNDADVWHHVFMSFPAAMKAVQEAGALEIDWVKGWARRYDDTTDTETTWVVSQAEVVS